MAGCEAWSAAPAEEVIIDQSATPHSPTGTPNATQTATVERPTATPSPTKVVEVVKEVPVDAHPMAPSPCYPPSHKSEIPPASSLQWSPDGEEVFFATDAAEVYAVLADGSRLRRLVAACGELSPGFKVGRETPFQVAPDGTRLVYATCEYPRPGAGPQPDGWDYRHELVVADIDGTQRQRLTTSAAFESYPTWSPDGSHIAYVSSEWVSVDRPVPSRHRTTRLYIMRADGTKPQRLGTGFDFVITQPPSWSPDGRWLAVTGFANEQEDRSQSGNRRWALHLIPTQSGREFLRLSDAASGASWSPDGQHLAFARLDDAGLALYTIAADATDLQRVTTIGGWGSWWSSHQTPNLSHTWVPIVAWSPDGSKILYSCGGICVVDLNDAPAREVPPSKETSSAEGDVFPAPTSRAEIRPTVLAGGMAAWSPDGSRIAILSNEDGPFVQTLAPDGSDVRMLVVQDRQDRLQSADDLRQAEMAARQAEIASRPPT